jgi:hypothetical protein
MLNGFHFSDWEAQLGSTKVTVYAYIQLHRLDSSIYILLSYIRIAQSCTTTFRPSSIVTYTIILPTNLLMLTLHQLFACIH